MLTNVRAIHPPVLGWLEKKLSQEEIDFLWKCIDNPKSKHNKNLAGNIHLSETLEDTGDWFFQNTLVPLCHAYAENFANLGDTFGLTKFHSYSLRRMWVNYQKKGEFNPLHDHGGVYSFVVWMKIPTEFAEQNQRETQHPCASGFEFVYNDILGKLGGQLYQLGKDHEGFMLFFPSKLKHQVYPFSESDETRISISGNVGFDL